MNETHGMPRLAVVDIFNIMCNGAKSDAASSHQTTVATSGGQTGEWAIGQEALMGLTSVNWMGYNVSM